MLSLALPKVSFYKRITSAGLSYVSSQGPSGVSVGSSMEAVWPLVSVENQ
jgi:hypothetical protein